MLLDKVIDNLAMTVEPFATCRLAGGWRMRLPVSDWATLHYALQGNGELRMQGGETLPMLQHSLAVVPPGLGHAVQCGVVTGEIAYDGQPDPNQPVCELVAGAPDEDSLTVVCGRVKAVYANSVGLFDHMREAMVIDFSNNEHIRGIFAALTEECHKSGTGRDAMMAALMNQCLIAVLRDVDQRCGGALPWLSALDDPRLSPVVEAMLDHPEQNHSLESLADKAAMSRATFVRHFEKSFGRTPMDYLRDVRMRHAAKLLQLGALPIDSIAAKVGYASRSHFSRAFHAHHGVSPVDFRKLAH